MGVGVDKRFVLDCFFSGRAGNRHDGPVVCFMRVFRIRDFFAWLRLAEITGEQGIDMSHSANRPSRYAEWRMATGSWPDAGTVSE